MKQSNHLQSIQNLRDSIESFAEKFAMPGYDQI